MLSRGDIMNLGFFTAPFQNIDLLDIADWGVSENFKSLEIACWPVTNLNQRRYAGTSHIDVKNITKNEACELADQLCQKGLTISGLGYYPNVMDPDPTHQELTLSHLSKVINCASWMNVPIVNTFCGGNSNLNIEENWEMAKTIWPDTISHALDLGVKITFENCPMIFTILESEKE